MGDSACIFDMVLFLEENFSDFLAEFPVKLKFVPSPTNEYDYQTNINELIKLNLKDNIVKYIDGLIALTTTFDYHFVSFESAHFLCFKYKKF